MLSYIDIHSHIRESENKDSNIISHPTISAADELIFSYAKPFWCGLHPEEIMAKEELITRLLRVKDNIVGIGEIGLDKLKGVAGQEELFRAQLEFASEHSLAVTLHSVRSHNELERVIKDYRLKAVVNHSFIGSAQIAHAKLARGEYLSFGPQSLSSPKTVEALRITPLNQLFCETDTKGSVVEVYAEVAVLLGVELEVLIKQLYKNYLCLIG